MSVSSYAFEMKIVAPGIAFPAVSVMVPTSRPEFGGSDCVRADVIEARGTVMQAAASAIANTVRRAGTRRSILGFMIAANLLSKQDASAMPNATDHVPGMELSSLARSRSSAAYTDPSMPDETVMSSQARSLSARRREITNQTSGLNHSSTRKVWATM